MTDPGAAILELVGRCQALRVPDRARLLRLAAADAIAIVGATGAGKSTIVAAIRAAATPPVTVPLRYLTRSPRENESPAENVHVSDAEFAQRAADGRVALRWERVMEGGRRVRYGFGPATPGAFPVYSGNNALWANAASVEPTGALDRVLVVGVTAPDAVREQRFRRRSPDLWRDAPGEASFRLAEPSDAVLPHVHLVLENHGALEAVAGEEAVALVRLVAGR